MPQERCALCRGEIAGDAIVRDTEAGQVRFDTEDCARVYEAARAAGMLDAVLPPEPAAARRGGRQETAFLTIGGMWCPVCASTAENALAHVDGVRDADVSFALGKARVEYDPGLVTEDELAHQVERLGYRVRQSGGAASRADDRAEESLLLQVLVTLAFGMQVMALYLVRLYGLYETGQSASPDAYSLGLLVWALSTPVLLYGGQTFLRGAWSGLLTRTANMDTLVSLGAVSAYIYSGYAVLTGRPTYFDSVTMVIQFVMVGRYLEAVGGARARKDVRSLLELQPQRAWRLDAMGVPSEVRAAELVRGDRIAVRAGERVPADATVVEGLATADESMLTGESAPATKRLDDLLWAGTVLIDGPVTATVDRPPAESRLASIRSLVEQTLMQKAPVQRLADRWASRLTLGILATALVTFGTWLAFGADSGTALLAAVSVLVVACPCALGLATPLAISMALGRATRAGVLVRVPAVLETAGETTTVVFDKTGTLTEGHLEVSCLQAVAGTDADEIECLVAGVERYSEHPLGRALAARCDHPSDVREIHAVPGLGVEGVTPQGLDIRVGAERFMPGPLPESVAEALSERAETGESQVWVALGGTVVAGASLRDTVAPGAADALAELRDQGRTTLLLSGDSTATTAAVARGLGFADYTSKLSPEDKALAVSERQVEGRRVAMVGDGINDAPALAKADLAITVAGGTDVASETSDVVLARRDLRLVPYLLRLSAATRRITRENLGWALAYNAIAVPLAATGRISPAIAAATMSASSLLVVGNSLRLGVLLRRPAEKRSSRSGIEVGMVEPAEVPRR